MLFIVDSLMLFDSVIFLEFIFLKRGYFVIGVVFSLVDVDVWIVIIFGKCIVCEVVVWIFLGRMIVLLRF